MKTFAVKISIGGALSAEVTDLSNAQSARYTLYSAGLDHLRDIQASSRAFHFNDADHKSASSFCGYGYLGGLSIGPETAVQIDGGLKIPNGPLVHTGHVEQADVDISVSHHVIRWAL